MIKKAFTLAGLLFIITSLAAQNGKLEEIKLGFSINAQAFDVLEFNQQIKKEGFNEVDPLLNQIMFSVIVGHSALPFHVGVVYSKSSSRNTGLDQYTFLHHFQTEIELSQYYTFLKRLELNLAIRYSPMAISQITLMKNIDNGLGLSVYTGSEIFSANKIIKPCIELSYLLGKKRLWSVGIHTSFSYFLKSSSWDFLIKNTSIQLPKIGNDSNYALGLFVKYRIKRADNDIWN